eukprot:SAG11_NODE_4303_length_1960_cov_1.712520_2_plen_193_part_00
MRAFSIHGPQKHATVTLCTRASHAAPCSSQVPTNTDTVGQRRVSSAIQTLEGRGTVSDAEPTPLAAPQLPLQMPAALALFEHAAAEEELGLTFSFEEPLREAGLQAAASAVEVPTPFSRRIEPAASGDGRELTALSELEPAGLMERLAATVDTLAARASPVVAGIVDGVAAAHRQVQCSPIKYYLSSSKNIS